MFNLLKKTILEVIKEYNTKRHYETEHKLKFNGLSETN